MPTPVGFMTQCCSCERRFFLDNLPGSRRRRPDGRQSAAVWVLLGLWASVSLASPPWDGEWHREQLAPARTFDLEHVGLAVQIDPAAGRIAGETRLTLRALAQPQRVVRLDAAELAVAGVWLAGERLTFSAAAGALVVDLPRVVEPGEALELTVRYAARPRQGLLFRRSDAYHERPLQAWSQGQCHGNRYWFPGWDYPNDRATYDLWVTVPAELTVVAAGAMEGRTQNPDGTATYHWSQRQPIVSYLVSVAVGEFEHLEERFGEVPLDYYVPPGRGADAARSFANTADMLRFMEEITGVAYPYAKYAQVCVNEFVALGMENASATTLGERTLHDEAAHLTYRSDGLVIHEVAHQWFGDLLTCRTWGDLWLNEGFATYAELLYFDSKWGEEGMVDRLLSFREDYFAECEDYRRPLVTRRYPEGDDLFDSHAYEKGALVLHMLRDTVGDDAFFLALKHYTATHADQGVETAQLRLAFEDATGRDLSAFFEQWVEQGGHPQLKVHHYWNAVAGELELEVIQTQEIDAVTPVFHFEFDLRAVGEDWHHEERLAMTERVQLFRVPLPDQPRVVQLDPEGSLLAEVTYTKTVAEWLAQLREATEVTGRVTAAAGLAEFAGDPEATAGLGTALRADTSRHVRAAAATALGKMATEVALGELSGGLDDSDARVRRAVASALGEFAEPPAVAEQAAAHLGRLIDGDPSPYVVSDAAKALGSTKIEGAIDRLLPLLTRQSHNDAVASGALAGLAATEDAGALQHLMAAAAPSTSWLARGAAIRALGTFAAKLPERRPAIRSKLVELTEDDHFHARRRAATALGLTEDPDALPILRKLATEAFEPDVRANARGAVWAILAAHPLAAADATLKQRLGEVEELSRQLREELDVREAEPAR